MIKNRLLYTLILVLSGFSFDATAQFGRTKPDYDESNNKGKVILFHVNVGSHLPAADMAKRFGRDMNIGSGIEWMSANNFIIGAEGYFFFGNQLNEDPLASLRSPDGNIIGIDQLIARVTLRERGFYSGINLGKLFVFKENKRSGLRVTIGGGWLQHKIRLQDDGQTVPLLAGEYAKGYDRLTGGPALNQFVGWQYMGTNRRTNFYVGFEFNQGFTTTKRDWDYFAQRKLDESRLDLRFGIRLGWTLPFYQTASSQIYY